MSYDHTIRPETINILGGAKRMNNQRTTTQHYEAQEESTSEQTWWGRFKAKARRALDKFKDAVVFVKENIVPILMATASFLNALGFLRRNTDNGRRASCAL